MTLEEAMAERGLNYRDRKDCEQYARILALPSFSNDDLPEDLKGLEVSRNGKCEWFKKKDFINDWKHGIRFEAISKFFGDPAHENRFELIYREDDSNSTNVRYQHYVDKRDDLIIRMDNQHYFVVEVDKAFTASNRIHLVMARKATAAEIEDAMQQRALNGSVDRFRAIISRVKCDAYDYFGALPKYDGDYALLEGAFIGFNSGDTPDETINYIKSHLGFSQGLAESIVHDWLYHRNTEYLVKLTKLGFGD